MKNIVIILKYSLILHCDQYYSPVSWSGSCVLAPSNHPIPCVRPLLTVSLTPNLELDVPQPPVNSPEVLSLSRSILPFRSSTPESIGATLLPTWAAVERNPLYSP